MEGEISSYMCFNIFSKKFLTVLLSFIMLFSFVGCSEPNEFVNIKSEKINYNNIYDFAHSGFWVNNNSIYYRKSGFYNDLYYCVDNKGKHLITNDNKFNVSITGDIEGKISSNIQAFGNDVYFWYVEGNGNNVLYQYNMESKEYKRLLSVSQTINDWTIVDKIVVYSTYINEKVDINSLWYCYLDSNTPVEIDGKTSSFGVYNKNILYTKMEETGKSTLYEYNYESKETIFLCSFVGIHGNYNPYNFTENSLIFATDKLHVVETKTGKQKSFDLPEYVDFLSCYEQYAFMCSNSAIYRANILTGEIETLSKSLKECNLLHAISDECVIAVCYNSSGIRTEVEVYSLYSNGVVEKILEI